MKERVFQAVEAQRQALCAMADAALGENERYAGAMARCNAVLGEFAVWLRQNHQPPARQVTW